MLSGIAAVGMALTGCSPAVEVAPAQDSANPACAPVMVALPDALADAPLRGTTSQATAAWGDPALVVLRCGVTPPGPTTDRCVSVNDVDWVIHEGDPNWTLTTYGRNPATEILFDPDKIQSSTVLAQLSSAAGKVPQERKCVGLSDAETLPAAP
jgi:hypothetical protein